MFCQKWLFCNDCFLLTFYVVFKPCYKWTGWNVVEVNKFWGFTYLLFCVHLGNKTFRNFKRFVTDLLSFCRAMFLSACSPSSRLSFQSLFSGTVVAVINAGHGITQCRVRCNAFLFQFYFQSPFYLQRGGSLLGHPSRSGTQAWQMFSQFLILNSKSHWTTAGDLIFVPCEVIWWIEWRHV